MLGVLAMLLNTLTIPFMGVVIKQLAALEVGTLEMLAMRSWITLGLLLPLLFFYDNIRAVKAADIKAHVIHASFAIFTMACFYYALRTLPLVTVTAINFTTPIFALIFARLLFGEKVKPLGWVALLVGFGGTLIVLRPDSSGIGLDSAVVLLGSVTAAGMNLAVRRMPARSTNYAVLFYFSLGGALVYGAAAAPMMTVPQPGEWVWLVMLAMIALAVHTCTTVAYRVSSSMLIGALDYARIIWAVLIGYIFLAELPDVLDGLGCLLIVLSGGIVLKLGIAKRPARPELTQ
ncbi:putative permease, DMT superfamily [Puniceibacterium sp. IMCC21224]|nr:putative permease, DMT superfamily [Puniceibacterium sp. IMCC21224]